MVEITNSLMETVRTPIGYCAHVRGDFLVRATKLVSKAKQCVLDLPLARPRLA